MKTETIKLMSSIIQIQTAITNNERQKETSYNKFKSLEIELEDLQTRLTESLNELSIQLNA